MTETSLQGAALVAMLVALPLISWGTTQDVVAAWIAGAVLIAAGAVTLTALRFVDLEEAE